MIKIRFLFLLQVRSITFGSPRVGNRAFYELFEQQTEDSWRITHGRDVVPSLPPTSEQAQSSGWIKPS